VANYRSSTEISNSPHTFIRSQAGGCWRSSSTYYDDGGTLVTVPISCRSNSQLREAVRAPFFRADSVMDEEQPAAIVLSFDFSQARVVAAPVCLLKVFLEVIALAHVCAVVPCGVCVANC